MRVNHVPVVERKLKVKLLDINDFKTTELPMIFTDGVFGLNPLHVEDVIQHENSIYMWFDRNRRKNNEPWDLEIPCASEESAKLLYDSFIDAKRSFIFKRVK